MKTVLFTLMILSSASIFACDVPIGEYRLMLETEGGGVLDLKDQNIARLSFHSYRAGNHNMNKTTIFEGDWSCDLSKLQFSFLFGRTEAVFEKPDYYPLEKYKNSKAIVFPKGSFVWRQFGYGVFWPILE